jgi:hypothetical protein
LDTLPAQLRRSLTWDLGSEMTGHAQVALATDLDIYFCDPHSPWQRRSNGLLRQYFPKGMALAGHIREHLNAIAAELNSRPRKTLGWKPPAQTLDEFLARDAARQIMVAADAAAQFRTGAPQHTGRPAGLKAAVHCLRRRPAVGFDPGDLGAPGRQEAKGQATSLPRPARDTQPWLATGHGDYRKGHLQAALQRPVEPAISSIFHRILTLAVTGC